MHLELCERLFKGEKLEGIESDPLLNKESEYEIDYTQIAGFYRRENSTYDNPKIKIAPNPKAVKHV